MQRRLRLHNSDDFVRLRQSGRTQRHPAVIVSYLPNHLDHNRYGFITSKRLGNAVTRNQVRRRLREAVRVNHSQICTSYDMVFIARQAIVGKPFHDVQRIVLQLCQKAGLLVEE